jgi:hypothetical protein
MNYLYLIQKKEYINQDIFKVGLINEEKKDNIHKEHKIILLIKNEFNCINFIELIELLKKNFSKFNQKKENYFIADYDKIILFILKYFKYKYFEVFNKLYEKICESTVIQNSEKCNQLIKLSGNDISVKKYLEELSLDESTYDFNYNIPINKINNYGEENMSFLNAEIIIDLLESIDLEKLINKFIYLVHFNEDISENKNILSDENGILKVYKNNKWIEKSNKRRMYKKIFLMNKYRLHIIFLRWFIINDDDIINEKIIKILKLF